MRNTLLLLLLAPALVWAGDYKLVQLKVTGITTTNSATSCESNVVYIAGARLVAASIITDMPMTCVLATVPNRGLYPSGAFSIVASNTNRVTSAVNTNINLAVADDVVAFQCYNATTGSASAVANLLIEE